MNVMIKKESTCSPSLKPDSSKKHPVEVVKHYSAIRLAHKCQRAPIDIMI